MAILIVTKLLQIETGGKLLHNLCSPKLQSNRHQHLLCLYFVWKKNWQLTFLKVYCTFQNLIGCSSQDYKKSHIYIVDRNVLVSI